ncbi:MAG: peroxiredoxin [Hydrocarboniphaga sp.]|uniref:peroxiredoxin n=1 Tax=Hydrocarboniphaga sp. TaxID=2033016 RepID=UPI002620FC83|nr:peroxiredoxin [Hydrocarboniphaga sp.]MDB5970225.1 peroxiredoxin [Hydrocarboniphaga sp.]
MSLNTGDTLPDGSLQEYFDEPNGACAIGPNTFKVSEIAKDKTVVLFAVPGAFTPGCSLQHVPGYVKHYDEIKSKGVDEIWCVSVNDAFVMGAWARDQKTIGKIRMFGDGSAIWTKALGLEFDLSARGMGVRSKRYAAIVRNGVVSFLAVEPQGKVDVSSAESVLKQL